MRIESAILSILIALTESYTMTDKFKLTRSRHWSGLDLDANARFRVLPHVMVWSMLALAALVEYRGGGLATYLSMLG